MTNNVLTNAKKKLAIFIYSIVYLFYSNSFCMAAIIDGSPDGDYSMPELIGTVITIVNYGLGIVGSICLLFIIYGGFLIIITGQGGSSTSIAKGKDVIIGAIIGLLIVLASALIIQFTLQALGVVDENGRFNEGAFKGKEWRQVQ